MSMPGPIIDVVPVSEGRDSSKREGGGSAGSKNAEAHRKGTNESRYYTFSNPAHGDASWRPGDGHAQTFTSATGSSRAETPSRGGRLGGAMQAVAGGALMLVGIPMLILPGPGLLALGGGAVLATRGLKRLAGR